MDGLIEGVEADLADVDESGPDCTQRPVKVPRLCVPSSSRPCLRSVVKVFVKKSNPNYAQPWQAQVQRSSTGSAFVIDTSKRRLLTNAHVVHGHITIHVRRPGHPKKWKASLLCEGRACDLALLTVEEEDFWDGIKAVKFLGAPELQQQITVTGYPLGGDSLSITQGIVSRVSMSPYVRGGPMLMHVQIDAAINPGNSGGPGFCDLANGHVVGVAFSRHKSAEATGYIIPYIVVQHFLECYERSGYFTGLCCLGVVTQRLENPSLRNYHKLNNSQSGALVKNISPLADASNVLRVHDIITNINGQAVADDGSITFRADERIDMQHVIRHCHIGDDVNLSIVRDGNCLDVTCKLGHYLVKLPGMHSVDSWPSYLIYGGLVFQPLSQLLLEHYFGRHAASKAPPALLAEVTKFREEQDESIVVLSQVLAADVTFGYSSSFSRVLSVNDKPIRNIYHLAEVLDSCTADFVRFELDNNEFTVLEREQVVSASAAIMQAHGIAEDRSRDIKDRSVLPKHCIGVLAGT